MRKQLLGYAMLLLALASTPGCDARTTAVVAAAATLPPRTNGSVADATLATLEHTLYAAPGRWNICVPNRCGTAVRDWGADSLTFTLFLRWKVAHDASIPALMTQLAQTAPNYGACESPTCETWSDVPLWDSIAESREFEVIRQPAILDKARHAFGAIDGSNAFARGACPAIDYQRPGGGKTSLKTLETDSNYIKAALLLLRWTGDRAYLTKAIAKYSAVRRYFLDPLLPLYTVYVFDDGRNCTQLAHRFYASVNGNMIYNGLALEALTGNHEYRAQAIATARAVANNLNDAAGVYADLQADNDVVEPLVEAMYDVAAERNMPFARQWLLTNAAAAIPAASGAYGRFFGGPAPSATVSAWSANGGLALVIAAGALDRSGLAASSNIWQNRRYVRTAVSGAPASITFTGRAIALIGTIGDNCCEPGHVDVAIDGRELTDGRGIWQNKSPAQRRIPNSILLSWRWPQSGRHTIAFAPGRFNAKEGGSYVHLQGYEFVP